MAGKDASGNTVPSYSSSITLSAYSDTTCTNPVQGAISATANPLAALSGIASFSSVRILKTSVQSLLASDGTRSVCTGPFTISAGAPASIDLSSGDTQSAIVGSPLASPLSVLVTDANHNPVPGARVTWTVSSGNGSLSSASSSTQANGMASVSWTLGTSAGSQSVQATLADLSAVTLTATATPGPATQLVFSTQPSSSPTAGTPLSTQPQLQILDSNQNLVTSASQRITLALYSNSTCSNPVTSTPSGVSATSGALELSAVNGIATFLGIKINRSGSLYLGATAQGLPLTCSSLLSVSPGAYDLTQSEVTASAESVTSGSTITATFTPRDAFGN
ncbi:MAG: hypothetical protein EBX36_13030, partial [Planctomycetia bacterium]|nr:hypothetical protein [Planctomycetia bacterium]